MTLDEMARYEARGGRIERTATRRIDDAGYLGPKKQPQLCPPEQRLQATEQAEKPKTNRKPQI